MIELVPVDVAHGGEAVARVDGKAHFVAGALPGERVMGRIVRDKHSWARVELDEVLEPSPHRVEPPCPHFELCGGCQWQFADYESQLEWKQSIVAGQLRHLGAVEEPTVHPTVAPGPPYGYRNRMDFKVASSKPALHERRSRSLVPLDECLLLAPRLQQLFGRLDGLETAKSLTIRTGIASGDTLAIVSGGLPEESADWGCAVAHRTRHGLRAVHGEAVIHETVADVEFRITGGSFFQNNTAGATALVGLVAEALSIEPFEILLDGYAGGGLFTATVGRKANRVIAVEISPTAVSDLRFNAENAGVGDLHVVRGKVETAVRHLDDRWDVAVVDPPREGLGRGGVLAVTEPRPRAIAYVSCDPASLARDARLLVGEGYRLDAVTPVDLFPQTFHVEAVARFERSAG